MLCFAGIAAATYNADWSTLDAGGGTSTGGTYAVQGTIGQTDTSIMSGGTYSVTGGFWALPELIQTPGAPQLRIFPGTQSNTLILAWSAPSTGWILQSSGTLGPWTNVSAQPLVVGGENQITWLILNPGERQFFRLARP